MRKNLLIISITLIVFNCSYINDYKVDYSDFQDIKKIDISKSKDTLSMIVFDDSWIFFDEYNQLKYNYLLWKNKHILNRFKLIKIDVIHNKDGYRHLFYANNYAQKEIIAEYESNSAFDSLSNYFLSKYNPTDVMNFRNVNNFLNENFKDYDKDYITLLKDISNNNQKSLDRLQLMINVLSTTGMNDFWTHEMIDAKDLIIKIEELKKISNKTKN